MTDEGERRNDVRRDGDERRDGKGGRRETDRDRTAERLLGSGLITELADDVRRLIRAVNDLRDEVRRRAAHSKAQRIRLVTAFLVALVVATQLSAFRVDACLLDVHYLERPTELCDAVFPVVTHGNLRALPDWPTGWNLVGLGLYGFGAVAAWVTVRRAGRLSSGPEPDEEQP